MMSPLHPEVMSHAEVPATLFLASEQGLYTPPDWQLELIRDVRLWFNDLMLDPWTALEPFSRRHDRATAAACLAAACG